MQERQLKEIVKQDQSRAEVEYITSIHDDKMAPARFPRLISLDEINLLFWLYLWCRILKYGKHASALLRYYLNCVWKKLWQDGLPQ